MELITGYKGTPHVTAAQFAALSRGFLTSEGSGVLIDPVTETFETQIQTNNQIRIRSGIGVLQGRAFWVQPGSYDEIPINNGNQGENRIDLVTARYTKNPETSVESINWMVIQGTPTTGTPSVPAYINGDLDDEDLIADMPMFQVRLTELSIVSVTPVYNMAAADYELDPVRMIQSGDDLDDYTDFGNFLSPSTAVSKSLKNCPLDNQGFSLRVMRGTSGAYRVQEIIAGLGDRLYRHYTGTTWSEWKTNTSIRLVWKNASPTSGFAAQKLTLSLTENSTIEVIFKKYQSTAEYSVGIFNVDGTKQQHSTYYAQSGAGFSQTVLRTLTPSTTGINFSNGTLVNTNIITPEYGTGYFIPIKIFEIKG